MRLFSVLTNTESRTMLGATFTAISKQLSRHQRTAQFLTESNVCDSERSDQPAYFKQLTAYHDASQDIKRFSGPEVEDGAVASELDHVFCMAVVHQSTYTLRTVSLRFQFFALNAIINVKSFHLA